MYIYDELITRHISIMSLPDIHPTSGLISYRVTQTAIKALSDSCHTVWHEPGSNCYHTVWGGPEQVAAGSTDWGRSSTPVNNQSCFLPKSHRPDGRSSSWAAKYLWTVALHTLVFPTDQTEHRADEQHVAPNCKTHPKLKTHTWIHCRNEVKTHLNS